jgi:diguanylate cyclase (GGDEF)-like protein
MAPRAPRLVSRFAVLTAVGLTAAAVAILAIVQHTYTTEGERQAIVRARYTADTVLTSRLLAADFERRLSGARRRGLDRLFRSAVLVDGTAAAVLYDANARPVYAAGAAPERRPATSLEPLVRAALAGNVVSRVGPSGFGSGRALRTFVPITSGGRLRGVVDLEQDYGPIAASARHSSFVIAGVLEGVLILLFVLLLPMVARARRRIGAQVEALDRAATHDELTGLPNRLGFQQAIDERAFRGRAPAVVLVDIADFHSLNDNLGTDRADHVLFAIGSRLAALEGSALVARLGGDEFGLLLETGEEDRLAALAATVRRALAVPLDVDGVRVGAEAVLGAAVMPLDGNAAKVLQHAGVALRVAKENGSGFELYEPPVGPTAVSRFSLANELRAALTGDELRVHYQPQADLASHAIRGVEALVRWQHPKLGLLAAGEFMPLAEQTSLARDIDRLVLDSAAAQWRPWYELGVVLDLAVNMTALGLADPELPEQIDEVLARHGLPGEHLVLEVTEHTLLRNADSVRETLAGLDGRGIRLAIDDYGTGYSSLSYLRDLHARQLKLDRTFTAGIPGDEADERIVGSTIHLAHALGATVVAEGVETLEQWNHLAALGCDVAQGYFIGHPVPADELTPMLVENPGLAAVPVPV